VVLTFVIDPIRSDIVSPTGLGLCEYEKSSLCLKKQRDGSPPVEANWKED
jgi:hypothetical protein